MTRFLLVLALAIPQPVWACSTCFDPKDGKQSNFLLPTMFMTLLPLTMLAVIGVWLWRAHKLATSGQVSPSIQFPGGAGVVPWPGSGPTPSEKR